MNQQNGGFTSSVRSYGFSPSYTRNYADEMRSRTKAIGLTATVLSVIAAVFFVLGLVFVILMCTTDDWAYSFGPFVMFIGIMFVCCAIPAWASFCTLRRTQDHAIQIAQNLPRDGVVAPPPAAGTTGFSIPPPSAVPMYPGNAVNPSATGQYNDTFVDIDLQPPDYAQATSQNTNDSKPPF